MMYKVCGTVDYFARFIKTLYFGSHAKRIDSAAKSQEYPYATKISSYDPNKEKAKMNIFLDEILTVIFSTRLATNFSI